MTEPRVFTVQDTSCGHHVAATAEDSPADDAAIRLAVGDAGYELA